MNPRFKMKLLTGSWYSIIQEAELLMSEDENKYIDLKVLHSDKSGDASIATLIYNQERTAEEMTEALLSISKNKH